MDVINERKSGEVIKDMRKVILPESKQKQLIRIYYKEAKNEKEICNQAIAMQ